MVYNGFNIMGGGFPLSSYPLRRRSPAPELAEVSTFGGIPEAPANSAIRCDGGGTHVEAPIKNL